MEYRIRQAVADDAASIADIYNHYIRGSVATFDTEPKTVGERLEWLAGRGERHAVLVCEDDEGRALAWGALSPYASRPAWSFTAEVAVYVAEDRVGCGIGPRLLAALMDHAQQAGLHTLVSQIVSENEASLRMTERSGFERVGYLREVGYKHGRWLDVVIMQYALERRD